MRAEESPLDLNNFPEDYIKDGKQGIDDNSSSAGCRRRKAGGKDEKDEYGKVYECRFCSLKFCKSQALGGHMNRHRQERETETLNRARQLVYNSDVPATPTSHHSLGCHSITPGNYQHARSSRVGGDPFRSVYDQPRVFPSSSSSSSLLQAAPPPQGHHPHFLYTSSSRNLPSYGSTQFPHQQPANEYYIGHVLNHHNQYNYSNHGSSESNYTCIGAPVGVGAFSLGSRASSTRSTDLTSRDLRVSSNLQLDHEGINWGSRSYTNTAAGTF